MQLSWVALVQGLSLATGKTLPGLQSSEGVTEPEEPLSSWLPHMVVAEGLSFSPHGLFHGLLSVRTMW